MRLHIVCFGNLIAGDDGYGIHVHRRLVELPLSRPGLEVALFDGGLLGFSALSHFEDCDAVLVIDALGYAGEEGRVHCLGLADVAAPAHAFSAHALDVTHLFHVLPIVFEGRTPPEVRIVGAEIHAPRGAFTMALSPAITQAVELTVERVARELDAFAACSTQGTQMLVSGA